MESTEPETFSNAEHSAEGKPALVTALCVIGVIVGGVGLCSPMIFLRQSTSSVPTTQGINLFTADRTVYLWQLAGVVINLVLSILLVVSAIGSMTLKPAARRGMVLWAVLGLAVSIGFYFLSKNILEPRVDELVSNLPSDQRRPPSAKTIGHVKDLLAISFELLVLLVFTRRSVIDSFNSPTRDPL